MSDEADIKVEITQPEPDPVEKVEPEKAEGDEWKILLGELKAKTEAQETTTAELSTALNLLSAGLEDLKNQIALHRESDQLMISELNQRLANMEAEEIEEEIVEESIPEVEPAPENVEESPEPLRKRPRLIG